MIAIASSPSRHASSTRIEVSALYHDHKLRQLPEWARQGQVRIDLRLPSMMRDLGLPLRDPHDPFNDAEMAALAFVKLRALAGAR